MAVAEGIRSLPDELGAPIEAEPLILAVRATLEDHGELGVVVMTSRADAELLERGLPAAKEPLGIMALQTAVCLQEGLSLNGAVDSVVGGVAGFEGRVLAGNRTCSAGGLPWVILFWNRAVEGLPRNPVDVGTVAGAVEHLFE